MHSRIFDYFDPVIFTIFGWPVKWYGLAYVVGILLGVMLLKRNTAKFSKLCPDLKLKKSFYDDLLIYSIIGIILGGRIGYMIFYSPHSFLHDPADILKVPQGGMSFHGGLLGVLFSCMLLANKHKIHTLLLGDMISVIAPVGIFFGRIANFINAELKGRLTNVSWGVIFPDDYGRLRHPSQLYEAFFEGILLYFIMYYFLRFLVNNADNKNHPYKPGIISGIFLLFYSFCRCNLEYFREPDRHLGIVGFGLTMGQILSILMFVFGAILIYVKINAKIRSKIR